MEGIHALEAKMRFGDEILSLCKLG